MEPVRYRPGAALAWLGPGTDRIREESLRKAQSVMKRAGARTVQKDVREVAGALWDAGSAAMAELARRQAEASQYLLEDESFSVISIGLPKRVRYDQVRKIHVDGDRFVMVLEKGSVLIRPFAHLVAGRVRVPIGWERNGTEVPYELLIEELSARCGLEVDFA